MRSREPLSCTSASILLFRSRAVSARRCAARVTSAFTVTFALSRDSEAWMRASASRSRMGAMRIFPTVDFSIRSSVVLRSWRNREVSGNTLTPILLAIYIFLPIPGLYMLLKNSPSFISRTLRGRWTCLTVFMCCSGRVTYSSFRSFFPFACALRLLRIPASRYVSVAHPMFVSEPSSSARHRDFGSVLSHSTAA